MSEIWEQPSPKIENAPPLAVAGDTCPDDTVIARLADVMRGSEDRDTVQLPSVRWLKEAS